jgi:hypothetical protein
MPQQQLRSTVTGDGQLKLELARIDVPKPSSRIKASSGFIGLNSTLISSTDECAVEGG